MIDEQTMMDYVSIAHNGLERVPFAVNLTKGTPTKETDARIGEIFADVATECGKVAAAYLFRSQWKYIEPEWFDHRLHFLDPAQWSNDYWMVSALNVIQVLPLGGWMLDLCSGDGFCDYHFYRHRANVVCVERDPDVHTFAVKHHSHSKIAYLNEDILNYVPERNAFDVVLIRGAIEHFSQSDQLRIFQKSVKALKSGGYFCGDTPAKRATGDKALSAHEHEWADEAEMRSELATVFSEIEASTLVSEDRTTLFWRCRKP